MSIKIIYGVDQCEKTFVIRVPKGTTVGEFLELARNKDKNPNYRTVWQDNAKLDDVEVIDDIYTPNDFIMISTTEQAPDAFNESITNPMQDREDEDNDLMRSITHAHHYPTIDRLEETDKFTVFVTGSAKAMLNGIKIEFSKNDTKDNVINKIKGALDRFDDLIIPQDYELFVFLPGGIPFLSGTIGEYTDSTVISHPHLYAIITKQLGNLVKQVIENVCDCSSDEKKLLLSPICESTKDGYSQIASLLGYIQHLGNHTEKLFLTLAKVTRFAPLITSFCRFFESAEIIGLNVIAITACLHTLCASILPENTDPTNVFDSLLKCCSFMYQMKELKYLKLDSFDWEDNADGNKLKNYCKNTSQQKHIIVWLNDTADPGFEGMNIVRPNDPNVIQSVFSSCHRFKPLPPLSVHYVLSCAFMKSGRGCALFLRESDEVPDTIVFIDPFNGREESANVNEYARAINIETTDRNVGLVDPEHIQQILHIDIDESISMNWQLNNRRVPTNSPELSRIHLTKQCIQAIFSRINSYRIACATGILTFNDQITQRYRLSAFSVLDESIRQSMEQIKPSGETRLWDAIKRSADNIIGFNSSDIDPNTINFPNAIKRILVISDGGDTKSEIQSNGIKELVQYLNEQEIIVDAVYISTTGDCSSLASLCHCTGGLCFQISSIDEGIQLFEKEAFMDISLRKIGVRTNDFIPDEADVAFDKAPQNKILLNAKREVPLATPDWIIKKYHKLPETYRERRIVQEICKVIKENDLNTRVCIYESNIYKWRAFIKGPNNTPYSGKWLQLHIIFTKRYPLSPPLIRFITIPYHPNVSDEGRPLFKEIDHSYSPTASVISLLKKIGDLLETPIISPIYINRTGAAQAYNENQQLYHDKCQEAAQTMSDEWKSYFAGVELKDEPTDLVNNYVLEDYTMKSYHGHHGLVIDFPEDDFSDY